MNELEKKKEALKNIVEYNAKLENGIENLVYELRNDEKEDTIEFLNTVVKGVNWVIEVTNLIMDFLNSDKQRIGKEEMNEKIKALNKAISGKEKEEIANVFEHDILTFLKCLDSAEEELCR